MCVGGLVDGWLDGLGTYIHIGVTLNSRDKNEFELYTVVGTEEKKISYHCNNAINQGLSACVIFWAFGGTLL